MPDIWTIIVAGGKGLRMNHSLKKQYICLNARPIVSHTLNAFVAYRDIRGVCLVVPDEDIAFCQQNIVSLFSDSPIIVAAGGKERQDSVYHGLCAIRAKKDDIVLIHDGVRPFVSSELISSCIEGALKSGACIPAIAVFDTLKQTDHNGYITKTFDRKGIWLAQTPQTFRYGLIRHAHEIARQKGFIGTDDASLLERLNQPVSIIVGSRLNIKITEPEDMILAEAIFNISNRASKRNISEHTETLKG